MMRGKIMDYLFLLLMRGGVCMAGIYFLNDALISKGFPVAVAINVWSFLMGMIMGIPGLCLLYGVKFLQIFG